MKNGHSIESEISGRVLRERIKQRRLGLVIVALLLIAFATDKTQVVPGKSDISAPRYRQNVVNLAGVHVGNLALTVDALIGALGFNGLLDRFVAIPRTNYLGYR
jgi:hypothetical protein